MKHLKCAYVRWQSHPVVPMRVDQLWQSVPTAVLYNGQAFYEPLKQDIQTNGLHNPIIVVKTTITELQKQKERYKKSMLDVPNLPLSTIVYAVWGGSNRLVVARELGYDTVDCIILDNDFRAAFRYQNLHRQGFMHYYTRGPKPKSG